MNFKNYYLDIKSNISFACVWINGGSCLDKNGKKGINQLLCSLLTRGCKDFDKYSLADHINSYGGELNYDTYEDGTLISIKSVDRYFDKLYPLLNLIIEKPDLAINEFKICKTKLLNNLIKIIEDTSNIVEVKVNEMRDMWSGQRGKSRRKN